VQDHAVVIGASIAGLLHAQVLSRHFARVTLIERDALPDGPEHRPGVPQSRHVHVMLKRGHDLLERFFPGLADEELAAGAPRIDWAREQYWYFAGGYRPRFQYHPIPALSRVCLEWLVRKRVLAARNIELRQQTEVSGWLHTPERDRVTGVRLSSREGGGVADLRADLVVDASGRSSRAPAWLEALGFGRVEQTRVDSFLGYASRWYRIPARFDGDFKVLTVQAQAPQGTRMGTLWQLEGGRWFVTLAGVARDYPPHDDAGFLEFARTLPAPTIYDAISRAEPLGPAASYRRTENVWNHYQRLRSWPDGLLVVGDAFCAFNPIYGQGMTVAAVSADALDALAPSAAQQGFARRAQRRIGSLLGLPWTMATTEDYRYPTTEGPKPSPALRLLHRYFDRVMLQGTVDPVVHRAFMDVQHLQRPPASLFSPAMLARVLLRPRARPRLEPLRMFAEEESRKVG
jgi:2-polyprenyl-6-methoxyphenol hydroxylase-like FAD-dependent oxidoreductase